MPVCARLLYIQFTKFCENIRDRIQRSTIEGLMDLDLVFFWRRRSRSLSIERDRSIAIDLDQSSIAASLRLLGA
jgi:hypothetical protein